MPLKVERLESRVLFAADIQVQHDPLPAAQPGDEVTQTIRVFSDSFDGQIKVASSLSAQLEDVRWQRKDGFAKHELPSPYLSQEPDFQIAAGRTEIWFHSIDSTGDPLGDLNGDGSQDFLFFNAVTSNSVRESVVVFGPLETDFDLGELAADGSEGFKLDGEVQPLGDVNGDGFDDIGHVNKIIFGAANLNADSPTVAFTDSRQLEPTGDINGDGFHDVLAVGSDSYLIFGRERLADLPAGNADSLASLPDRVLSLGESVSSASPAGDLNHDGIDDVVFGVGQLVFGNRIATPFVLFGDADFPTKSVNFDVLDGTDGFSIGNPLDVGLSPYVEFSDGRWRSWHVSGTSDINGDSIDDLVVSFNGGGGCENSCTATDRDNIDVDAGVFVLHGGTGVASSGEFRPELDSHSAIRLATSYSERLGRRLDTHVIDANSDGLADIHVTAGAGDVRKNYVFFGEANPSSVDLGHALYPFDGFNGENGYQHTGDLRFLDVNGDGFYDALLNVLVHQPSRSSGGPDHRVDVFLGKSIEPTAVVQSSGDIEETVELDSQSSVIYEVTGTLKEQGDSITTVAMPVGQADVDLTNNLVSDQAGVSLGVVSSEPVISGDAFELQVTVTNDGPATATDVRFSESITSSLQDVTWTRSTQLFPASISLFELPVGLGATLEAPEIVRIHEHCGCPTEALNQYLGRDLYERLGSEAGSLGDVNGDGFDDIFLSDDGIEPGTLYWQFDGRADFGADGSFPMPKGTITQPETAGMVADINGDGFEDQLSTDSLSRKLHVVYGNAMNELPDPSELNGANGFTIVGFRPYVSSYATGDINGDGLDDVIVAEGKEPFEASEPRIYVVLGGTAVDGAKFNVAELNGFNGFRIETHVPESSTRDLRIVSDFDINGDGLDDILIGSPSIGPYNDISDAASGEAYLIFGRSATEASGIGAVDETIDVPVASETIYTVRGVIPGDSSAPTFGLVEVLPSSSQIELDLGNNIIQIGDAPALTADLDGNERVDFADFLIISHNFGRVENAQRNDGDINRDAVVDFADFLILRSQFGQGR